MVVADVTISAWLISVQDATVAGVATSLRQLFGERVRELRSLAGFSQEAFADHCGYARSYMSRVERGTGNPSLDAIEAFAVALNVPVAELFTPGRTAGAKPRKTRKA